MGVGRDQLAAKAKAIGELVEYRPLFAGAFAGAGATPDTVVKALAASCAPSSAPDGLRSLRAR
jgi:hypothetical protein